MTARYDPPYERGRLAAISKMLPAGKEMALDLGCGVGIVSELLAERGWHVLGIDLDESALEAARVRVPSGRFLCSSITSVDLPSGAYDVVMACEVIEHFSLEDQARLLARIRKFLSPRGHLIMSTPNCASVMSLVGSVVYPLRGRRWDWGDASHLDVHNTWTLRSLLHKAGFRISRQLGFQLLLHRPRWLMSPAMRDFEGALSWICYDILLDVQPA